MRYHFPKDTRESGIEDIGKVHKVLLRMLKILNDICNAHNVDYWLDYGTLLGAIRHKGFIPWDHEIDIGMLRGDFEKFLYVAKNDLPNDLFLQTKHTDVYYTSPSFLIEAKIRDKYSNYKQFKDENPDVKWHNGFQIDIFVYDYDDELENCFTNSFERYYSDGKIHLKEEEIKETVNLAFEDIYCPVPIGYDNYLKRNYDDYWKLPAEEQRIPPYVEVFHPCEHTEILNWFNTSM